MTVSEATKPRPRTVIAVPMGPLSGVTVNPGQTVKVAIASVTSASRASASAITSCLPLALSGMVMSIVKYPVLVLLTYAMGVPS